jgi:hypothetical protein
MDIKQVVILVFVVLLIIYIALNAFSKTSQLTKMADGKKIQTIKADELKNVNNSSNFTYSMWFFVDDWNYLYGQEKMVLDRANSPTVVLGNKPNTLAVKMRYYDKNKTGLKTDPNAIPGTRNAATDAACLACQQGYTCACDACNNGVPDAPLSDADSKAARDAAAAAALANSSINTCLIENIPIQKWVNIIISLYGLTLDVYLDGKLVRTCVMPGVPQINNAADINVTNKGGFSGWTTNFKYWSDASNPQEAYNIYKSGFGGSILGNALSKYRVQVSMLKDNVHQGGFQI